MANPCIKVNCSGSWANLVPSVIPAGIETAKAACEQIAMASLGPIAFRLVQDGTIVEEYTQPPRAGEPRGWHAPRQKIQLERNNPVTAGLDRTTSGAIGQP